MKDKESDERAMRGCRQRVSARLLRAGSSPEDSSEPPSSILIVASFIYFFSSRLCAVLGT